MGKEKVIPRRIDGYSPSDTARIIKDGLNEFNLMPKCRGQITIKPDMVMTLRQITGSPPRHTNPVLRVPLTTGLSILYSDLTLCSMPIPTCTFPGVKDCFREGCDS